MASHLVAWGSDDCARGLLRRWTVFNLVGVAGVAVQLGTLAVLVHCLHVQYLAATALAVEAAVVHNFLWHQRWTWRDRPAGSPRALIARLWRFHLLNGAISLGGNLSLMALLSGVLHVPVVAANLAAVIACSLVNFVASDAAVFRSAALAAALVFIMPPSADAGQEPQTTQGWNAYQATLDSRYEAANATSTGFIHDRSASKNWRERIRRDGVLITSVDPPSIPGGKIHHWVGAVWVPGLTVQQVIDRLESGAGTESRSYEDVLASKLLERDGDRLRVFMKLQRHAIITVTYNTEHLVEYRRLGPSRASMRSVATRIAELEHADEPDAREKPPGRDSGFLWRLVAYWRYEEADGGVLVECESVSLSRPVPFVLRPIASPIVDRIARESLERTLTSLRRSLSNGPVTSNLER
jgi:putative flippase GtrA